VWNLTQGDVDPDRKINVYVTFVGEFGNTIDKHLIEISNVGKCIL